MKKNTINLSIILAVFLLVFATAGDSYAKTAKKNDLSIGGYFGIGGATKAWENRDGAFALGIQPEMNFFVIDNLSVNFRFLWERIFYKYEYTNIIGGTSTYKTHMDIYPFLFGARYYFPIVDKLHIFAGLGLGFTVSKVDQSGYETEVRFMMDFNGGIEFEVIKNLGLTAMFDIMLPNIAPRDSNIGPSDLNEEVIARFMFFLGVNYYFNL